METINCEIRLVANAIATVIRTNVTESEFKFLVRLQDESNRASKNPDMPVMVISKLL